MSKKLEKLFAKFRRKTNLLRVLFFLSVIVIAIVSRRYRLTDVPHGFFCDEAAIGYNAYKLLSTGKDEYGISWPFFFRSFGDFRNPVPVYLNIPFVFLFGLTDFSVRFCAALFGLATVILIFFFGRRVGGYWTGFFASFFLATSPWHIHLSRVGLEYVYFPFFLLSGLYLWLFRKRPRFFWLSILSFGVSLYTYYPAWLIIPLFIFGLVILSSKEIINQKKQYILGTILFLLLMSPLFNGIKTGKALTRWNQVQGEKMTFMQKVKLTAQSYFGHFSSDFLLTKGDIDYPGHFITRHSVRGFGQIYIFILPLTILGITYILWRRRDLSYLLFLLLLYPLGSALTDSGPFATRSILGIIPFAILPALGLDWILKKFYRYWKIVIIFALLISLVFWGKFMRAYFTQYPLYSSDFWGWQYGPKEIVPYFTENQESFDEMYLEGQFNAPTIFIPFFSKDKCVKCFVGSWEKLDLGRRQLFAVVPLTLEDFERRYPNVSFSQKKVIYYPNKLVAFVIIEPALRR